MLRTAAIVIQLFAVLSAYFLFDHQLALLPLVSVILVESLFQLASVVAYRNVTQVSQLHMTMQLLADLVFLTVLLSFSGGATNAFVSLLLLPIVIAAVTLASSGVVFITALAIASYSALLIRMPEHAMHTMDMQLHFIGMWANFVLSALVVALVVTALARSISNRERAIARSREAQLRSEQLVALGSAAAQVTHQLATPLATIELLYEELVELYPDDAAVKEMNAPLERCREQLNGFRKLAGEVSATHHAPQRLKVLVQAVVEAVQLQYPDQQLVLIAEEADELYVSGDPLLLSALLNLMQNAVRANRKAGADTLELSIRQTQEHVELELRDYGGGIEAQKLDTLGTQLMPSDDGLGLAVLLSNATIERLHGHLTLTNHTQQGAVVTISLPKEKHEVTDH